MSAARSTPSSFPGFPAEALRFLEGLARHNTREWFQEHKADYEAQARGPMLAFVEALNEALSKFAPSWMTEPKKALFRLNRDTRFSADKSPYKTELGARFGTSQGPAAESAGFYVSVSPKGVGVGAGCYMADTPQVAALRTRIATDHVAFRRLVEERAVTKAFGALQGERLVRVPKPFPAEHPAADLLRLKQACFLVTLPVELVTSKRLVPEVAERFRLGAPLVTWLAKTLA